MFDYDKAMADETNGLFTNIYTDNFDHESEEDDDDNEE